MKRAYRLRRPHQFRRARREGRSFSSPLLTLNVVAGRRRRTRCGFVVTRQLGTAVRRNRAKRRVREAVRLVLPSISPGYDLVFVVRSPEILLTPFPALRQLVEQLLRRSGLWHPARPEPPLPADSLPQPPARVGMEDASHP
jgi:ribonuclease P protein component